MSSEWETVLLGDLCKFTKGTSPTQKTLPGEYPLIVTGPEPLSSSDFQFEGEAVCVPMVSSTGHGHASLKRVHYASGRFALANIVTACEVNNPSMCSTRFLHIYLQHFKDELIVPRMQGTANVSLSQRELAQVPVRLPHMDEQQRIVDLIAAVDGAIDTADKGAANSDALWWRLTSELQERVSKTESLPFGAIAAISGGLTKNKKDAERPDAIQVPYLRVANVHRRYLDLSEVSTISATPEKLEALRLQPGDLLLNEGGDKDKLGRGAIWRGEIQDCIHQNHVFRARITDARFVPEFVSAWSNSFGKGWFETYGTQTTGIASISKTTLSIFPVPCLSIEDQRQWADLLDSTVNTQDSYFETARSLRKVRTEILSALLSGAHRIPETYDELMGA